jgi:hypothetical protein
MHFSRLGICVQIHPVTGRNLHFSRLGICVQFRAVTGRNCTSVVEANIGVRIPSGTGGICTATARERPQWGHGISN